MKKMLLCAFAALFSGFAYAQSPSMFSYQAIVRNSSNQPVVNQTIGMRISIYQYKPSGEIIYGEHHSPTTNENGLVSIMIGGGNPPTIGFIDSIPWHQGPFYLSTEIDPTGGNNYNISGTTQLLSVPYALHAQTATVADSVRTRSSTGSQPQKRHYIGELFGGGIIVDMYTDSVGEQHGMIMALKNLPNTMTLARYNTVGPNDNTSWDGKFNTREFVQFYGAGDYAAYGCDTFTGGGFTDWYLPSLNEFERTFDNAYIFQPVLINHSNAEYLTEPHPTNSGFLATSTRISLTVFYCYNNYDYRFKDYLVTFQNSYQRFSVRPFRRF